MKLDLLGDALQQIHAGATADSLETETLDFKRDPHTVTGRGAPGNPQARLIEELVDTVVCFANGRGGRIVLGIDDRTPGPGAFYGTQADMGFLRNRIYGNTRPQLTVPIDEIEFHGTRILVITVPEGLDLITDSKGKALGRSGTSCAPLTEDARRALAHQRRNPDLTARPSDRAPEDVSPAAISEARRLLGRLVDLRSQMADLDDASLLRALNLVDREGRLLLAGEILLCTPEQDVLDILGRPAAGAEPSVRRLREPLVQLLPHALDSIRSTIDPEVAHIALAGGQEVALPDFSPIAVDEAVTNALVHRDYSRPERVVIDHSPNALRIWSPGGLPFGVTEDRLLSTVSTPRNATLMSAMQQLGLAERASRGIDRMFREQVRVGQQVPGIRADEFSVEVYFTSGAPNRAFAGYVATLPRALRENVDAMLTLVHLCERSTLTLADGAQLLQVTEGEAKDRLDALGAGDEALVERDGDARRGVRWRLRPSVATALGTAVKHRTRADSARPRVEAHLKEYGWITNKTIRNMFDLDVQQATQILNELRSANVVVKDPDGPQRGPSIRWLPAEQHQGRGPRQP
ncbi:putative DNA binding domain-containing protein [Cellulosimicrobium cellulans]|uniref:RNA-binding domain-containing protein n=1 Tax=Cellulosimicrobium cellulans TaxID=1710 RepID=UPI001EDB3F54|nr:RNA-binding domain-containing protein [Cellulosimicrobium cellulans]UKJ63073.1 putative DNA binding domain-containing protein [Cellulosimicrobium cellulans]